MAKYISGRVRRTDQDKLTDDRFKYLRLEDAEPNLGDSPNAAGTPSIPSGQQFQLIGVLGNPGERYWSPIQGGVIPGSISIFEEGSLVGTLSSITQLDFRGNGVTATVGFTSDVRSTITVRPPGDNERVLYKENNDFASSNKLQFKSSVGILTVSNGLQITGGGSYNSFVVQTDGKVGINTVPSQELHVNGDIRLEGTIYDQTNNAGANSNILQKNNAGGVEWKALNQVQAGAGGTIKDIQYHGSTGVVAGASNFNYDPDTQRVGLGIENPETLLDVRGDVNITGLTTATKLDVTGVSTFSGITSFRNDVKWDDNKKAFFGDGSDLSIYHDTSNSYIEDVGAGGLKIRGTSVSLEKNPAGFAPEYMINAIAGSLVQLYHNGSEKFRTTGTGVSITGTLDTDDLTTDNINITGKVTTKDLQVTGIATVDNIQIYDNRVETTTGNLVLNSSAGTLEVIDKLYVNDVQDSTTPDNGAVQVAGGVGIEKRLNVGGAVSFTGPSVGVAVTLAGAGGITTTGGDLYIGDDLYVNSNITVVDFNAQWGNITKQLNTNRFKATGISTFTNKVHLLDDDVLHFGGAADANGDLQIWHNSSNTSSNIKDTSGDLNIQSNNIYLQNTSGVNFAKFTAGGEASLYHSGNLKFTTSGIGVTVTGKLMPSATTTHDIGSATEKWNSVHAQTFIGAVTGISTGADRTYVSLDGANSNRPITFVDNNTAGYKQFYFDANTLSFNPSANRINITNATIGNDLTVTGPSTFSGLVDLNADIEGHVSPSATDTYNMGASDTDRWNNIYAQTFIGQLTGNAVSADTVKVSALPKTFGGGSNEFKNTTHHLTFIEGEGDGSAEDVFTHTNATFTPRTNHLVLATTGLADSGSLYAAGKLETGGDLIVGDDSTLKSDTIIGEGFSHGSLNVKGKIISHLIPTGNSINIGSASTSWGTVYADSFTGGSATKAETVQIHSQATGTYHLTFVGTSDVTGANEYQDICVDSAGDITYDMNANKLVVPKIQPGQLLDASDTGNVGDVPVSDGTNWTWGPPGSGITTTAQNLQGGVAYKIPYQTAADTTAFLPNGTDGKVLTAHGTTSAPSWESTVATATNLLGGAKGSVPYQSDVDTTAFLAVGTAGKVLTVGANDTIVWGDVAATATNLVGGSANYPNIVYQSAADTTNFLVAGASNKYLKMNGAGNGIEWGDVIATATNLNGGVASQIPYQSAANTTAFIPNGTSGKVLTSNGTNAPSWEDGVGSSLETLARNTSTAWHYLTFVDSNNTTAASETVYTTSSLQFKPTDNLLKITSDDGPGGGIQAYQIAEGGSGKVGSASSIIMASGSSGDHKWYWTDPSEVVDAGGGLTNIEVLYTNASNGDNYSCAQSVSVSTPDSNTKRINFQFNGTTGANAYGRKFFQNTAPSSPCDGDIWYDTSTGSTGSPDSLIPAGSRVVFYQSNAPTGWTKITNHNNKALRVVSGSGGGSGGSHSFTSTFANKSTGNHTITSAQVPAHNHTYNNYYFAENNGNSGLPNNNAGSRKGNDWDNNPFSLGQSTNNQAGTTGQSHNHGSIDLRVQYIDVIICSKDA
tara:strand:+ start:17260 stop:21954 length:4695 start_codon:yes stop_codon:yes gene_type:complete